ncbi:CYSTM domain-containing protein [Psidium guajava]|nr:CYSTM domain-containing protein [Psidium guajava]
MSDIKYAYPYPASGVYGRPRVMAPPLYAYPLPRTDNGFLDACLAALCFCCLLDACCWPWDPFLF